MFWGGLLLIRPHQLYCVHNEEGQPLWDRGCTSNTASNIKYAKVMYVFFPVEVVYTLGTFCQSGQFINCPAHFVILQNGRQFINQPILRVLCCQQ